MAMTGMGLVWAIVEEGTFEPAQEYGVRLEHLRAPAKAAYDYVHHHFSTHGKMPEVETVILEALNEDDEEDYVFKPDEPASYYAEMVQKRAALQAQREHVKLLTEAVAERDPIKVNDHAKDIIRISTSEFGIGRGSLTNTKKTRLERWEEYEKARDSEGGVQGIRSPWAVLDDQTCGFMDEDLITIVARLGLGKTWTTLQIACHAQLQGYNVGLISMEMSRKAMERRRDALIYKLPYNDFKRGELDHDNEARYEEAMRAEPKEDDPNFFIAAGGRVNDIADAELFLEETGVDFLIIDGIYLMSEGHERMARHERIEAAVRGAKRLAQRRKIPILITAQFNREIRSGALRGEAGSIGGSDAIGQDSDVVLALFQDDTLRASQQMVIRSLKVREGSPVEITINWDFVRMNFEAMATAEDGDDGDGDPDGDGDYEMPF